MDENVGKSDNSEVVVDMQIMDCSVDEESDVLFEVPTQNRFDGQWSGRGNDWKTVRRTKRKKVSSTDSTDTHNFDYLSDSDKLIKLFETVNSNKELLLHITEEQSRYHRITDDLRENVNILYERTERTERRLDQQTDFMKMLAYRSIDTEARSRRNNVIIWGVTERSQKNSESLVLGFLEDELDMDTSYMVIDRAHRMGSITTRNRSQQDPKRPIIVRFRDYNDTEAVMKRAYKLKGTSFGLDRDYPMEIATARKDLFKSEAAREARAGRKKIQIRYPAKLYIEGSLVEDKFPEWHHLLKKDRIACLEDRAKQQEREDDTCSYQGRDQGRDRGHDQGRDRGDYDDNADSDNSSASSSESESEMCEVKDINNKSEKCKQSYSVNTSVKPSTSSDRSSANMQKEKESINLPSPGKAQTNSVIRQGNTKQLQKDYPRERNKKKTGKTSKNDRENKNTSRETHTHQCRVNEQSINRTVENLRDTPKNRHGEPPQIRPRDNSVASEQNTKL